RNTSGAMRIDATGFYTFESPARLPNYQNQYGQGAGGEFDWVDGLGDGVNDGLDQSFGPKLDGRSTGCVFVAGTDLNNPIGIPSSAYDKNAPCRQFDA